MKRGVYISFVAVILSVFIYSTSDAQVFKIASRWAKSIPIKSPPASQYRVTYGNAARNTATVRNTPSYSTVGNTTKATTKVHSYEIPKPIRGTVTRSGNRATTQSASEITYRSRQQTVQFGKTENQIYHTFRHTDALGLDRSLVQSTIQNNFKIVSSQVIVGKPFNQVIEIGGERIQYTVFKLSDGTINIGRIHGVK